jgi:hypothetical protein
MGIVSSFQLPVSSRKCVVVPMADGIAGPSPAIIPLRLHFFLETGNWKLEAS